MTTVQPHRGAMILVFGILGLVTCPVFAVVAWVMGKVDLREIDAGRMDPEGRSLTQAGMILGMITVGLYVLGLLIGGAFLGLFVLTAGLSGG